MEERNVPSTEHLRDLAVRLGDEEHRARGEALWRVIQEEVDTEVERRFHALKLESTNSVRAVVTANMGNPITNTVSYLLGITVNGKELEAVVDLPMKVALLHDRAGIIATLKKQLSEQLAGLLLEGIDFPKWGK